MGHVVRCKSGELSSVCLQWYKMKQEQAKDALIRHPLKVGDTCPSGQLTAAAAAWLPLSSHGKHLIHADRLARLEFQPCIATHSSLVHAANSQVSVDH